MKLNFEIGRIIIKNIAVGFISIFIALLFLTFHQTTANAQVFLQDSTLNNLVHPVDYKTSKLGELGNVIKHGSGKQAMILLPGLGFGAKVFDEFIKANEQEYSMYAITPAGFAGTAAPPMPDTSVKYAALPWTNGIVTGILNLIEKEKLEKPVILAHFVTATQVALNLALHHPGKIGKIVIIGGSPYRYYPGIKDGTWSDWENERVLTPAQRAQQTDAFWAPRWFKTVTKKTWDSNMWTPDDYCKDSVKGKELFQASADVPLQVMIRYLIEWMAYDVSDRYKEISVPVMFMIPDFEGMLTVADSLTGKPILNQAKQYLPYFHTEGWKKARESNNPLFTFKTISDTRIFMWYDKPKEVSSAIYSFLNK